MAQENPAPRDSLVNCAFWLEQPLEDLAGRSPIAIAVGALLDLHGRTGQARYERAAEDVLRSAAVAAAEDPLGAAGYWVALAEAGTIR